MSQIPNISSVKTTAINQEQLGPGKKFCDDLNHSRVMILRVQAEHEPERNKVKDLNQ